MRKWDPERTWLLAENKHMGYTRGTHVAEHVPSGLAGWPAGRLGLGRRSALRSALIDPEGGAVVKTYTMCRQFLYL